MFERFTDRARQSSVLAQEEARKLGRNCIDTEHLLLGLLREDEGVAALALKSLNVTVEQVIKEIDWIVGRSSQESSGHIPFTPQAKKILEFSLREALQLGHNYIGTEHILLAIVHEEEGVAVEILEKKVTGGTSAVRKTVLDLLTKYQESSQKKDGKKSIMPTDSTHSEFQLALDQLITKYLDTVDRIWTLHVHQTCLPDITVTADGVKVSESTFISPQVLAQLNRILQPAPDPEEGTSPL